MTIPTHVGLVPDGTRRWAKREQIDLTEAYRHMMIQVGNFIEYAFSKGSTIVSIYLLSKENLGRVQHELDAVIKAESAFVTTTLDSIAQQYACSVNPVGDIEALPALFRNDLLQIHATHNQSSLRQVNLLCAYSPWHEVQRAVELAANTSMSVNKCMMVEVPIDLVIRTGDVMRLSNFLPLQTGYAELFFIKKYINELNTQDYDDIFEEYRSRQRRYGH